MTPQSENPKSSEWPEVILIKLIDQVTAGDGEPLTEEEVFYKAVAKEQILTYLKSEQRELLERIEASCEDCNGKGYIEVYEDQTEDALVEKEPCDNALHQSIKAELNKLEGDSDMASSPTTSKGER